MGYISHYVTVTFIRFFLLFCCLHSLCRLFNSSRSWYCFSLFKSFCKTILYLFLENSRKLVWEVTWMGQSIDGLWAKAGAKPWWWKSYAGSIEVSWSNGGMVIIYCFWMSLHYCVIDLYNSALYIINLFAVLQLLIVHDQCCALKREKHFVLR